MPPKAIDKTPFFVYNIRRYIVICYRFGENLDIDQYVNL